MKDMHWHFIGTISFYKDYRYSKHPYDPVCRTNGYMQCDILQSRYTKTGSAISGQFPYRSIYPMRS